MIETDHADLIVLAARLAGAVEEEPTLENVEGWQRLLEAIQITLRNGCE